MEKNDIKKLLYKHKPTAELYHKNEEHYFYETLLDGEIFYFKVPVIDMGDAKFKIIEPAQLLIRYLV